MLQRFSAALLATACLAAVPALAQPVDAPARGDRAPTTRTAVEQRAAAMFARLDADGDSQLTPADREKRHDEMADRRFERLDADNDGSISRAEFDAAGEARSDPREQVAERRAAGDEPREGRRMARMAHRGDRMGRGMGAERMLARADGDSDGTVSQAEFTSAMLARFDAADADHDGTISAEERRAQRDTMRNRMGRRGAAPEAETR